MRVPRGQSFLEGGFITAQDLRAKTSLNGENFDAKALQEVSDIRRRQRRLRRRRRVNRRPIRRASEGLASAGGAGSSAVIDGDGPSVASSSPQCATVSERPFQRS